jgi:hypothetical protein
MRKTQKAVAILALSLAALPWSIDFALADKGPIVHDYSNTGPTYHANKSQSSSSGQTSASQSSASNGSSGNAGGKPYIVKCSNGGKNCKVGPKVMQGYQTFGGNCARCHGESGQGSTFAPSLVGAIQNGSLGEGRFAAAVAGGITQMDTTTGTYRVMPAWANNPGVMNNLTQIWAYLKVRADGKVGDGRPTPIKGKD